MEDNRLLDLIQQVRKERGVCQGVTVQPRDADLGCAGQQYQSLIYAANDSLSDLDWNPSLYQQMINMAETELSAKEKIVSRTAPIA